MTTHATLRRATVIVGVAGAILIGALTVRAAALWAAESAPLSVPPVTVASLQDALAGEQARSAEVEDQLGALEASSGELQSALDAALEELRTDQATAQDLRDSLDAARTKLAKLEASLGTAGAARTTTRIVRFDGAAQNPRAGDDDEDHEDHEEIEHEDD